MILFLVLICSTATADSVVTEGKAIQQIPCPDILCELCEAPTAFEILSTNFLIPGYLLSTSTILQRLTAELLHSMAGIISVAVGERWMCLQVTELTVVPPLPDLYNSLLDLEMENDHRFIESFKVGPISKVITRSERSGVSGSWEQVLVIYYEVESNLEDIEIYQIKELVHRETQEVLYHGSMDTVTGGGFVINSDYQRGNYGDFDIVVDNEEIMLGEVQESFGCESIVSPRGLSSVNLLAPFTSTYGYTYSSGKFSLTDVRVSTKIPDFSPGQGLLITDPISILNFTVADSICVMEIDGDSKQGEVVILLNSTSWSMFLHTGKDMTLREYETMISDFYYESVVLFPVYESQASMVEALYSAYLLEPVLEISYLPETIIDLKSRGMLFGADDSEIIGHVSRVDTVLESSVHFKNINAESVEKLVELYEKCDITSSTVSITQGDWFYPFGIQFLCGEITGQYFPDDFYLSRYEGEVEIAVDLVLTNTSTVYYLDPLLPVMIKGSFNTNIDSLTLLNFTVNVTSIDNNGELHGLLEQTWENAFGIQDLDIPVMKLQWKHIDHEIGNQENYCEAAFMCSEEICWSGMCEVTIDLGDSHNNVLDLQMNPISSEILFSKIFETDDTLLSSGFEFVSPVDIQLTQDHFTLGANGMFLKLPAVFSGQFFEDPYTLDINTIPFIMGFGNIRIYNTSSDLKISLTVTPGYLSGNGTASVQLWEVINENLQIFLDENTLDFSMQGNPFGGVFDLAMTIQAIMSTDIETSKVDIDAVLSQSDVDTLTALVQAEYIDWIAKGLITLNISANSVAATEALINVPVYDCKTEIRCSTPVERYCVQYSYGVNELEYSTACESVSISCLAVTVYCIEEETTCTEWMKNIPNTCKKEETVCVKTVDVCNQWGEVCNGSQQGGATLLDILSTDDCVELRYGCNSTEFPDLGCESEYIYDNHLYESDVGRAEMYEAAYNETLEDLEGFVSIYGLEEVFVMVEARIDREINETAIGINDIRFIVRAEIYCLDNAEMEEFEGEILWNFYDMNDTAKNIFKWSKSIMIERSGGMFTKELNKKAPIEIYLENVE